MRSTAARIVANSAPSLAPRRAPALRRLQRGSTPSPFVFVSAAPLHRRRLCRMIERAAAGAGLKLKAHPHMLRHACGYALANKGHDTRAIQGWLGHRSITSTAVYTALAPSRFKDFWRVRRPVQQDHQGHRARPWRLAREYRQVAKRVRLALLRLCRFCRHRVFHIGRCQKASTPSRP